MLIPLNFKSTTRYGVPFSFVYCTIYQQDIWRDGDERLFEEQRRTWRKFFTLVDNVYHNTMVKLNLSSKSDQFNETTTSLVAKFDSLDMRNCWNNKVLNTFATVDRVVENPKVIACKVYRKIQPYISTSSKQTEVKTESPLEKTNG